jgi:FemAB-related protein (PEP-CTERM system-associated)
MTAVLVHDRHGIAPRLGRLEALLTEDGPVPLSRHPAWLLVLERELKQVPYLLESVDGDRTTGFLPLAFVKSYLFGRFLVSLPYLNYGGVYARDEASAHALIDRAVELARELRVRYLELRHETPFEHPELPVRSGLKVHMRLPLPTRADDLWKGFDKKVRNQVRKGEKNHLEAAWGGLELLDEFYDVFSRNMRDLGTPVYARGLFAGTLRQFSDRSELCVVRHRGRPAAVAILLHGWQTTEIPSASSVRPLNKFAVNMFLYWNVLKRAVERGQKEFDFGRSTRGSSTHAFKEQWGALEYPAEWQYHILDGKAGELRKENPGFRGMIELWRRLPVSLTRLLGPSIVRCIP